MDPKEPEVLMYRDAARLGGVDMTIFKALISQGHLERHFAWGTFYERGIPFLRCVTVFYRSDVIGLSSRWVSVSEAADIADMATPRGMYNRVLKNHVKYIRAPEGEFFRTKHQEGLEILVDRNSIKPYARPFR